jgi:type VI secretion system protein ImpA
MLTPELVEALQAPISEASPSGDDLEYDPAFLELDQAARGWYLILQGCVGVFRF